MRIEIDPMKRAFDALRASADAIVVEGVDGFLVPLNDREDAGDIPAARNFRTTAAEILILRRQLAIEGARGIKPRCIDAATRIRLGRLSPLCD